MSEFFEIGEIAILDMSSHPEWHGPVGIGKCTDEVMISGSLMCRAASTVSGIVTLVAYQVVSSDGRLFIVIPQWLRKRKPPAEKTGSWDECPWKPGTLAQLSESQPSPIEPKEPGSGVTTR